MPVTLNRRAPDLRLLVLGLAMLVFGLLQINDLDPVIWVGYYALLALACTLAAYRPLPAVLFWAPAVATAAGLAVTLPGFADWLLNRPAGDLWATMSADRMYIEHSREFLGLLIGGACLVTARGLSHRGRAGR